MNQTIFKMIRPALAIVAFAGTAGIADASTAAPADAGKTAVVAVKIRVLPWAAVQMDGSSIAVTLPPGASSGNSFTMGGTIRCNVGTTIYTRINKPSGAPGEWTVEPEVRRVPGLGVYRFDSLLRITVWDVPAWFSGTTFQVGVLGQSAASPSLVPSPMAGYATITVVPD